MIQLAPLSNPDLLLVVDSASQDDLGGPFPGRAETERLVRYLAAFLKKKILAVPAAPAIGKLTATQYREYEGWLEGIVEERNPTAIALLGKGSVYPVDKYFPAYVRSERRWNRVTGKVFELLGRKAVISHSPSALFADKSESGGYLHLRTLIEDLARLFSPDPPQTVTHYRLIKDAEVFRAWLTQLPRGEWIGFDLETTGLNFQTERILTVQFSAADYDAITVPWELLPPEAWPKVLAYVARDNTLVMANGKFDYKFLRRHGVMLPDWVDVQSLHVMVDEREGTHNLNFIAQQTLGEGKYHVDPASFSTADVEALSVYAARDADITRRAALKLQPQGLLPSFQALKRAGAALAEAEYVGIRIDLDLLETLDRQAQQALLGYHDILSSYDVRSPNDNRSISAALGLHGGTAKDILEGIDHPLAHAVLDARGLHKVRRTYLDRIRANAAFDGRFHADYRLAGPATGRLSCGSGKVDDDNLWQSINLMNIPRPALSGHEFRYESERIRAQLRDLFVADEGQVIIAADYEAAESRMAANLSGDEKFIADMNNRFDTHSYFAVLGFGLPIEIDEDNPKAFSHAVKAKYAFQRQQAKTGFFARLYGAGINKIAASLGIEYRVAKRMYDAISQRYPDFELWVQQIHRQMYQHGGLRAPWGRERIFPLRTGLFGRDQIAAMQREGVNTLIQGMASDVALKALGNFDAKYRERGWQVLIFVHDSIEVQAPEAQAEEAKAALVWEMEHACDYPAVLYAEAGYAKSWGAA